MPEDKTSLSSPGIKIAHPPVIFVLIAVVAGLMQWSFRDGYNYLFFASLPIRVLLGAVIAAPAGLFMLVGWAQFILSGTSLKPYQPASMLVETGAYRFSRNPMYVGFVAVFLGASLALGSLPFLLAAFVMFLYLDRFVIPREERYLLSAFGPAYEAFMARVRRWL